MNWITIIGIILIAIGTFMTYIGQNKRNKSDIELLHKSIGGKNAQIDDLVKGKNELLSKIDKYQQSLSEKDETIKKLKDEVGKLSLTAPKLLPDGRIAASPYVFLASEFSDGINRARDLFSQGKYDEAYTIANEIRKKNSEFGLAQFLLGTIELQRGNLDKGEEFIEDAIKLGLPDGDRAWAFHNIGVAEMRKHNIEVAMDYFNKAVQVDPNMEESKRMLKSIENQLGRP